ncbi:hypothetical protein H9P43_009653 [Blastocladiella emersonii ATCC 22665]|nr:hypothetical protein H9P43_009653 [Blastocladiella emersonii ATCC 22665]
MLALSMHSAAASRAAARRHFSASPAALGFNMDNFWTGITKTRPRKPAGDAAGNNRGNGDDVMDKISEMASTSGTAADGGKPMGRSFARRRQSGFTPRDGSAAPSPADGSAAPAGDRAPRRDQGQRFEPRAPRTPKFGSSPSTSMGAGRFIFETYQPPTLSAIRAAQNPWTRDLARLPTAQHGEVLTEEKVKAIREAIGGDYKPYVVALPEAAAQTLSAEQRHVAEQALRVLNANASYKVADKVQVIGTIVEGMTGGEVKRADIAAA